MGSHVLAEVSLLATNVADLADTHAWSTGQQTHACMRSPPSVEQRRHDLHSAQRGPHALPADLNGDQQPLDQNTQALLKALASKFQGTQEVVTTTQDSLFGARCDTYANGTTCWSG